MLVSTSAMEQTITARWLFTFKVMCAIIEIQRSTVECSKKRSTRGGGHPNKIFFLYFWRHDLL